MVKVSLFGNGSMRVTTVTTLTGTLPIEHVRALLVLLLCPSSISGARIVKRLDKAAATVSSIPAC